ncbi:MAG: helix-turn-helix domain-containing protein [Anaerolineae bacterium]|nr:helix-turn-helix domain-containing protein [Anaerolineae bacterium]
MIQLSEEERQEVEGFIRRGKANARTLTRAHVLLKDADGWTIARLSETFHVSPATVSNIRQRYRQGGINTVLTDQKQQNRRRALSGAAEAMVVAVACSPVPDGHDHWTVRMIRDKLVEMGVVDKVSHGTVHNAMKKMNLSPGSASSGVSRKRSM